MIQQNIFVQIPCCGEVKSMLNKFFNYISLSIPRIKKIFLILGLYSNVPYLVNNIVTAESVLAGCGTLQRTKSDVGMGPVYLVSLLTKPKRRLLNWNSRIGWFLVGYRSRAFYTALRLRGYLPPLVQAFITQHSLYPLTAAIAKNHQLLQWHRFILLDELACRGVRVACSCVLLSIQ